jgi:hypothetical protein
MTAAGGGLTLSRTLYDSYGQTIDAIIDGSMMREIFGLADDPPARRRWFHDDFFDLFVWEAEGGEVTLFQLCYGLDSSERALVWDKGRGLFHDGPPGSPDFVPRFEEAAAELPENIKREVREKVHEFAGRRLAVQNRRKRFRRADWQGQPPQ